MQVLVTGGAGFISGHLAEAFPANGHNVTVLDVMDPFYDLGIKEHTLEGHRETAIEADVDYEFVEGDVRDADLVAELVADTDYVYHQAAKAGVRPSVEALREYNAVNVNGTLNLLDAAHGSGIEQFVMASSSVYNGRQEYLPFSETDPTLPVSPYGILKLTAEWYAAGYHEVYDLPTVSLRYFTVYGPRMRPNIAILNFVSRCLKDESPVVYGDGTQTRDFTYIEDVLNANRTLLSTDAANGEAVNVGSTDNIEIRTLAAEIRDQLAPDLELAFAERCEADADHTHADITKAEQLLGYASNTPSRRASENLLRGISRTVSGTNLSYWPPD